MGASNSIGAAPQARPRILAEPQHFAAEPSPGGRVWRFTGNVPGTVTEATREEANAILGPYNASKAAVAAAGR